MSQHWILVGKNGKTSPIVDEKRKQKNRQKKKQTQKRRRERARTNVIDTIPTDVLLYIFSFLPCIYGRYYHSSDDRINERFRETCMRWFRIFTDINLLVRIWPVRSLDSNIFGNQPHMITETYLNKTLVAPTTGTINQLVFTYPKTGGDVSNYGRLFLNTFRPNIWKNMRLPIWEEIDHLDHVEFLSRGETAFRHLMSIAPELNVDEYRGITELARAYDRKMVSVEFVDWCMDQSWLCKYPKGIVLLLNSEFPLDYIEKYANIPMQFDFNDYPYSRKVKIKNPRQRTVEKICNELICAFRFSLFNHTSSRRDPKYLQDALQRFYRLAPLGVIRNWFCDYLRVFTDNNKNPEECILYHIAIKNQGIHPLSGINVPTWFWKDHQEFREFTKKEEKRQREEADLKYDKKIDILREKVKQKQYESRYHYYDDDYYSDEIGDLTDSRDVLDAAARYNLYVVSSDEEEFTTKEDEYY